MEEAHILSVQKTAQLRSLVSNGRGQLPPPLSRDDLLRTTQFAICDFTRPSPNDSRPRQVCGNLITAASVAGAVLPYLPRFKVWLTSMADV